MSPLVSSPHFILLFSSLFFSSSFVSSEFVDLGSSTSFTCHSQKISGDIFAPILQRFDEQNKAEAATLYVGAGKRPIIDNDWSVNKTKNETTKIETFQYNLVDIEFGDAGIYLCKDKKDLKKNVTVIGDKVICKHSEFQTRQGDMITSSCELPVNGPDFVDLGWYLGNEKQESTKEPVKPADFSVTSIINMMAQPEHHEQKLQCRSFSSNISEAKYPLSGAPKFTCEVSLDVKFDLQIKGKAKTLVHNDIVETEIHVIGNPWPGKKSLKILSEDIIHKDIEIDELDGGYGAEVTVHIPVKTFEKKPTVNVIIEGPYDKTVGTVDIVLPPKSGNMTYIIVIVVLALAAILLLVGVIYFVRRSKQKKEDISKGTPLTEQANNDNIA